MNNNTPENWRQDLLLVGFFDPLNAAATEYFRQVLGDPKIVVTITHKVKLDGTGLQLFILLQHGDIRILNTDVTFHDQQIIAVMKQHKVDLQTMLGSFLADVCNNMFAGLVRSIYKDYFLKTQLDKIKPKEDATVDNQIQAHDSRRKESEESSGNGSPSGN